MKLHKVCNHCGTLNQLELQHEPEDNSWQVVCLTCGNVMPVPDNEIPESIKMKPRQYEVIPIQSTMEANTSFNIPFGYYSPKMIMGGGMGKQDD